MGMAMTKIQANRGAMVKAMTLAMGLSEVVTRISFTFLFTACMGYKGLWWVSPITWVCAVAVGAIRYYSGKWEEIARKQAIAQ